MPGKGHRFTEKEDRQAQHVAASERARGKSAKTAKRIGYATVVSQGGGKGKRARSKK
jgi:hypothetical protein